MSLVATSEHGSASTPGTMTLYDLRRGVVSRRASLTGSGASVNDDDCPMTMSAISRRASLGGMALPPTTQFSPHMNNRPTRSRSTQRQRSDEKSVSRKQKKSFPQEAKSSEKKGRGRSQSVQRSSKSTDKSKSREMKKRSGRSSNLPPETRAPEKKRRGRSQSVHRSIKSSGHSESKSSGKPTSAIAPETQAPDRKARARSKSTQRRTCKTTKEQARRTYDFNKFETDHATKCEAEAAEIAETKAAESAVGRRRARSQSVSHRRPSALPGLGKAPSTPNSSIQSNKSGVHSKDVSTFGTALDHESVPREWGGNKDALNDFSGAKETSDFPAPAWDDPWADEKELFNPVVPIVITKVETTSAVPANPNSLFRSEFTGLCLGSTSSHSRGGESTSSHSRGGESMSSHSRGGGGSSDLGTGSVHSRGSASGGRRRNSLTLPTHMNTSFGGKVSDAGSVFGRSRISLQGIRRSHNNQGPTASTLPRVPPPTAAALFAEKLEDAKRLDQARNASQRVQTDSGRGASSGQVLIADSDALFDENLEAAKKFDEIRKISHRLIMADSGLAQARGSPLQGDSGRVIAADFFARFAEKCEAAKKPDDISKVSRRANSGLGIGPAKRKPSNAPQPTSASAFAAKLQAARQHDDSMRGSDTVNTEPTASINSTSTRRSSMSSGSSISSLPWRQSTERAYHSPRPDNIAKKTKQLRRGSSMM